MECSRRPLEGSQRACCPVLPQEQTSLLRAGTSVSCHFRTHALQQTASLFDDLVGESEQLRWQFWAECFESQKINRL